VPALFHFYAVFIFTIRQIPSRCFKFIIEFVIVGVTSYLFTFSHGHHNSRATPREHYTRGHLLVSLERRIISLASMYANRDMIVDCVIDIITLLSGVAVVMAFLASE
jgi:hypothetical protein